MSDFIGIDPGATGGMAHVGSQGELREAILTPSTGGIVDSHAVALQIRSWADSTPESVVVVIENVHSMPRQGVASTFKFGRAFGTVIGVVVGLGLPLVFATPQEWKKLYGLTGKPKDASRMKACELWPYNAGGTFKLKKSVDAAEAALIANYGRRIL